MCRLLTALSLAFAAGCTTIHDRLVAANDVKSLAQAVADYYVKDGGDDTCAVGVVRGDAGEPVFASAGGVDEHSLYRIASLSKMFLYPVLLNLHGDGRIDLDRPVTAYSKLKLPPECTRITLRDLLENKSGLPREFLTPWNPVDMFTAFKCGFIGSHIYGDFDGREDFQREIWRSCWRAAMREGGNVYSNVGFGLLGMAIEDALGRLRNRATLWTQRIFRAETRPTVSRVLVRDISRGSCGAATKYRITGLATRCGRRAGCSRPSTTA